MINMLLRFLAWLPIWIVGAMILPWPLVPIGAILADKDGRLPVYLRWLETHDNLGWHCLTEEETLTRRYHYWIPKVGDKWARKITLCTWLWRNKAYTLRSKMGPNMLEAKTWRVVWMGGTRSMPKVGPGLFLLIMEVDGKKYFELRPSFGVGFGQIYMRIGWKVYSAWDGHFNPAGPTGTYTGITPRYK